MGAPPGNSFRTRWMHAVYASKLTLAQRDTMNAVAMFIKRQGVIQVPRTRLAEITRRARPHIEEHITAAIEEGLLELVDRPARGRPATYRAIVPAP